MICVTMFDRLSCVIGLICLGDLLSCNARTSLFEHERSVNHLNIDHRRGHNNVDNSYNPRRGFLTDLLSNSLNIIPGIMQQVKSVMNKPEILPSLARTITQHVMGGGERSSLFRPTPELIESAGYASETHYVQTPDRYILALHRIINKDLAPGRPVVFLQHGILCSSADWVMGHRDKAFGYLLADAGYDVWLGNFRGNIYSRNHTDMDPDQEQFWRFSWDEMGQYDLPAMLFYVTKHTGQSTLVYVGHSMGTTAFWVMMNRYPQMNSMIQLMVGMAPVAAAEHMYSPIKYIAPVAGPVERVLSMTGQYEFWPRGSLFTDISETLCDKVDGGMQRDESVCSIPENIIFLIAGFDAPQMNFTLLPEILRHTPAGTSARTLQHFAQGVNTGRFSMFDQGSEKENMIAYGSPTPPEYLLSMVSCPVVLYWADNDWLAHPTDVAVLADNLPNLVASYKVPFNTFNHLDFLWGKTADSLLYKPAIKIINQFAGS